jgi:DNA-directed RNA polymerase subunit L
VSGKNFPKRLNVVYLPPLLNIMDVRVLKEDQKSLELEISGIDQSVLQVIQQELLTDENVSFAAFNKPHPLLKTQKMSLIMKTGKPRQALQLACDKAYSKAKALEESITKALEQYGGSV